MLKNDKIVDIKQINSKHLVQLVIIREVIFLLGAKEEEGFYSWSVDKYDLDNEGNMISKTMNDNYSMFTLLRSIPVRGLVYKNRLERIRDGFSDNKTYIDIKISGGDLYELKTIEVFWKDDDGNEYTEVIYGAILESLAIRVLEKTTKQNLLKLFKELKLLIEKSQKEDSLTENSYKENKKLSLNFSEDIYSSDWEDYCFDWHSPEEYYIKQDKEKNNIDSSDENDDFIGFYEEEIDIDF